MLERGRRRLVQARRGIIYEDRNRKMLSKLKNVRC
jgi:hypothetical protein